MQNQTQFNNNDSINPPIKLVKQLESQNHLYSLLRDWQSIHSTHHIDAFQDPLVTPDQNQILAGNITQGVVLTKCK